MLAIIVWSTVSPFAVARLFAGASDLLAEALVSDDSELFLKMFQLLLHILTPAKCAYGRGGLCGAGCTCLSWRMPEVTPCRHLLTPEEQHCYSCASCAVI
eukprot:5760485-Amphidinium_carterae.1